MLRGPSQINKPLLGLGPWNPDSTPGSLHHGDHWLDLQAFGGPVTQESRPRAQIPARSGTSAVTLDKGPPHQWAEKLRERGRLALPPELSRSTINDGYCDFFITNCSVTVAELNSWRARKCVCGWERRLALPGGPKPSFLLASSPQPLAALERECNGVGWVVYSRVGLGFTSPSPLYLFGTPSLYLQFPINKHFYFLYNGLPWWLRQ